MITVPLEAQDSVTVSFRAWRKPLRSSRVMGVLGAAGCRDLCAVPHCKGTALLCLLQDTCDASVRLLGASGSQTPYLL